MITLALIFVAYWLPSLLAFHRGHKNRLPILMVNFSLGMDYLRLDRGSHLGLHQQHRT